MDRCPSCNGFGVVFPAPWENVTPIECDVCYGSGEINGKQKLWIEYGKRLKKYRIDKLQLGLREASRKYNIDASNLSKMERGVIKPKPPKEIYQ